MGCYERRQVINYKLKISLFIVVATICYGYVCICECMHVYVCSSSYTHVFVWERVRVSMFDTNIVPHIVKDHFVRKQMASLLGICT